MKYGLRLSTFCPNIPQIVFVGLAILTDTFQLCSIYLVKVKEAKSIEKKTISNYKENKETVLTNLLLQNRNNRAS